MIPLLKYRLCNFLFDLVDKQYQLTATSVSFYNNFTVVSNYLKKNHTSRCINTSTYSPYCHVLYNITFVTAIYKKSQTRGQNTLNTWSEYT